MLGSDGNISHRAAAGGSGLSRASTAGCPMSSWSTGHVDITRDTTTLNASDGDVFLRRRGSSKGEGTKAIGPVLPRRGARPRACSTSSEASTPSRGPRRTRTLASIWRPAPSVCSTALSGPHGSLQRRTKGRRSRDEYGLGERLRAAQAEKPVIASASRRSSPAPRATSRPTSC